MSLKEPRNSTKKDRPLFSVVIPAYDSRATISASVESALQNETSIEVLVIDDGSPNPIVSEDLPPGPVRLLPLRSNGGTARARNHGIMSAEGQWIAFLDADDTYEPQRLDAAEAFLAERDVDGLVTDTVIVSADGSSRVASPSPNEEGLMHLRTSCIFGAHILSRSVFERFGLFDSHWRIQEDADLWLRMTLGGARIAHLSRPAYVYRLNDEGKTLGRDPVVGLHETRNIHLANAIRPGIRTRDRALLLARAAKWERGALPYHLGRLRRSLR
jgi:glycosyltransferase involved in cell wall biosynthesis